MKKAVLIIVAALLSVSSCQCSRNPVERFRASLTNYSAQRPCSNILSEREAVSGAIDTVVRVHLDTVQSVVKEMPDVTNASIGNLVLVEDINSPWKEKNPYYYYINLIMPDNTILVEGYLYAMADKSSAGHLGSIVFGHLNRTYPKEQSRTSNDALNYIKNKLNLTSLSGIKMKAILLDPEGFSEQYWQWAFKLETSVSVKTLGGITTNASLFIVQNRYYSEAELGKVKTTSYANSELKTPTLSILPVDVFDESIYGFESYQNYLKTEAGRKAPNIQPIPIATYGNP